jgi:16S rRNA (cytosine967-C5)-methyltransferase
MTKANGPRADPARRTAHEVLTAVSARDAYANLLLARSLREAGLSGKDAALATELVYGTLRNRGSYDAIIGVCADRDLDRIDPAVLDALRLGAHQLLGMRVKPHAAVASTVDLAVNVAGRKPAGFVNAILRRIAPRDLESWLTIAAPDRAADPVAHLAVRYSHPRWMVTALADALGEDPGGTLGQTEALLAADGERPLVHLAAIPGLASQADLVAAGAAPARWSPFGAYLERGDPAAITAVAQRRAGVQDEASQLAALALARAAAARGTATGATAGGLAGGSAGGERGRWLDLCAGPGGKARLLAGLAATDAVGGGRAWLLASDLHVHRAALAGAALAGAALAGVALAGMALTDTGPAAAAPAGAASARAIAADGLAPPWRAATFDLVLADVPCSGLGSLRRRPEARWRRTPEGIAALGEIQRGLLAAAIDAARPGGVVGYVTCSPHLAETRLVLADVLAARDDVEVLDAPAFLPEVDGLACAEPYSKYAQFWPHRHGTDAMFIAILRVASGSRG